MARVPQFTREVFAERSQPSNIESIGAIEGGNQARALYQRAEETRRSGERVGAFGDEIMRQRAVQGRINAQKRFNEFQRGKIKYQEDLQNQRMTRPDGFADEFDTWYKTSAGELEDSLGQREDGEPLDMDYLRQLMDSDRTQTLQATTNWESGMRVKNITTGTEQSLDEMNVNFSLANPRLSDLPKQLKTMREYVNNIGANVLDPEQSNRLFEYGANQATSIAMNTMLDQDPRSLKSVLYYGQGKKEQLIDMTMFDIEGGDQIAPEPGGGIAKFGISSDLPGERRSGLTEEQVRALTPEAAREIYAKKYWDPRLDKMTPAMRSVAFDAIVNHGNDKNTWSMIEKAKGDPYRLIELRQQYYAQLVQQNPEKNAKYARGWENRLKKITSHVNALDGGSEFLQYASLLDPSQIDMARNRIPEAIAAKDRQEEAVQKQKETEYVTARKQAYDIITNNLEPIGQEEINTLKQLAVNTGNEELMADAQAIEAQRGYVNSLKGMDERQLRKVVRQASADVNKNPNPNTRLALELAEGVLSNQISAVKNEGLAYWGRVGQIRMPQPVSYNDLDTAKAEVKSREDASLKIYQKTGQMLPVLTPDELTELKTMIDEMPANQAAGVLSVYDNLSPTAKERLAQAADEKSPILGTALAVTDLETRRRIIQGAKIEAAYDKNLMADEIKSIIDPMTVDPEFRASATQAIMAWYNAKSVEERDDGAVLNTGRVREAVQNIYGPIVDLSFVGTNTVFSFKDPDTNDWVSDDDLYDMFNGITDPQLEKLFGGRVQGIMGDTITAEQIKESARIVSAGDGLYNITFDKIGGLYDENGQLIEIDGRRLLSMYKKERKKK
jgi:hypothetical protein